VAPLLVNGQQAIAASVGLREATLLFSFSSIVICIFSPWDLEAASVRFCLCSMLPTLDGEGAVAVLLS